MNRQIKKVLFIAPNRASFVLNDIRILKEKYEVVESIYDWQKKWLLPFLLLRQLAQIVVLLPSVKAIVVSFGGYWAVIPSVLGKLFGIKTFIILHGTDCARLEEFDYGMLRKPLLRKSCFIAYKHAFKLLPVSDSLVHVVNRFCLKEDRQGIKAHFPELKTPHTTISNGLDVDFWTMGNHKRSPNTFVAVLSASQFNLKGADLIVEAAQSMPNDKFLIVGLNRPTHIGEVENLTFLGRLSPSKLRTIYQTSHFYFQLSVFEGFGCALCEAMLCGLVPIVSNVNVLPKIVGPFGVVLSEKRLDMLLESIKSAKLLTHNLEDARGHIMHNYSLEKRKSELLGLLDKL